MKKANYISIFSTALVLFFTISCFRGQAQVVDTAEVRRVVDSLLEESKKLLYEGDFPLAANKATEAKAIAVRIWGNFSEETARCLLFEGKLYSNAEYFTEAEKLLNEALSTIEQSVGNESPKLLKYLNALSGFYSNFNFNKGEPFALRAQNIAQKNFGKESLEYAVASHNLASIYTDKSEFDKAEVIFQDNLKIFNRTIGKNTYEYGASLTGLAALFMTNGAYEKVEKLYLEAKIIYALIYGEESIKFVGILNNLAILYRKTGQIEQAEDLYKKSIDIVVKTIGIDNLFYSDLLNNLSALYTQKQEYEKAIFLIKESMKIVEEKLGEYNIDYAELLYNLALNYYELGDYTLSEVTYQKSLNLFLNLEGDVTIHTELIFNNLANLHWRRGDLQQAETLHIKAKYICETIFGRFHPDYTMSVVNLAKLYRDLGNLSVSEMYFKEAITNYQKYILSYSTFLANIEFENILNDFQYEMDHLNSLNHYQVSSATPTLCYENVIFQKEVGLGKVIHFDEQAKAQGEKIKDKYERWKALNRIVATELSKPIGERADMADFYSEINLIEKFITKSIPSFEDYYKIISYKEVNQKLKKSECAIEFIKYNFYTNMTTDSTLYAALLLLPNAEAPLFIPLCEQRQLDALMLKRRGPDATYIRQLYAGEQPDSQSSLYQLLWAPVEQALAGKDIRTVYFAPAGDLHRLNLGAFRTDESGQVLADDYHLIQLGSTRELVTNQHGSGQTPTSAVVYGGVQYVMDSTAINKANREMGVSAQDTTGGWFRYSAPLPTKEKVRELGDDFQYLQGTEQEARHLHDLLLQRGVSSSLRLGYFATEESFKQLGIQRLSPNLLHIGTHGFFFPDPKDTSRRLTLRASEEAPAFKISEHPLIRSGVLLAGAEYAWKTKHPMPGMEDGVLTAHEVSQLDLSNTQLVVLSACETGLGDIRGNEGVYGLQRAFRIAGAQNVLMSLWKVNDEATALLLNHFYENWLVKNLNVHVALEQAQAWMRTQEGYENPYFWAGFVLVGE